MFSSCEKYYIIFHLLKLTCFSPEIYNLNGNFETMELKDAIFNFRHQNSLLGFGIANGATDTGLSNVHILQSYKIVDYSETRFQPRNIVCN